MPNPRNPLLKRQPTKLPPGFVSFSPNPPAPVQSKAEEYCWVFHPSYGFYFIEGTSNYHYRFFKGDGKGNSRTEVIPNKLYDDCNRGYTFVDREKKTVQIQTAELVKNWLDFVPQKVLMGFKKAFPRYDVYLKGCHLASLRNKVALDALLEMINDEDYATHQHHSDPDFTTQNGKDYAGRGSTEVEQGALNDAVPGRLLASNHSEKLPIDKYPVVLYHGTSVKNIESIKRKGLQSHFPGTDSGGTGVFLAASPRHAHRFGYTNMQEGEYAVVGVELPIAWAKQYLRKLYVDGEACYKTIKSIPPEYIKSIKIYNEKDYTTPPYHPWDKSSPLPRKYRLASQKIATNYPRGYSPRGGARGNQGFGYKWIWSKRTGAVLFNYSSGGSSCTHSDMCAANHLKCDKTEKGFLSFNTFDHTLYVRAGGQVENVDEAVDSTIEKFFDLFPTVKGKVDRVDVTANSYNGLYKERPIEDNTLKNPLFANKNSSGCEYPGRDTTGTILDKDLDNPLDNPYTEYPVSDRNVHNLINPSEADIIHSLPAEEIPSLGGWEFRQKHTPKKPIIGDDFEVYRTASGEVLIADDPTSRKEYENEQEQLTQDEVARMKQASTKSYGVGMPLGGTPTAPTPTNVNPAPTAPMPNPVPPVQSQNKTPQQLSQEAQGVQSPTGTGNLTQQQLQQVLQALKASSVEDDVTKRFAAWMPCPTCKETPSGSLTEHIRQNHPELSSRNPGGGWKPTSESAAYYQNTTSTGDSTRGAGSAPYGGSYTQKNPSVMPDVWNFPDNIREGRYSFVEDCSEWTQAFDILRSRPVNEKLVITLSPQTIAQGDGKDVKSTTMAFARHLMRSLAHKGLKYRVMLRAGGLSVIVSPPEVDKNTKERYIGTPRPTNPKKLSSKEEEDVPVESMGEQGESAEDHFEEKYIHLQLVEDEAIPTSVVDFELLRKFTGSPSFNADDCEEVQEIVAQHGYSLEIVINPPDEDFFKEAAVEIHKTPVSLPPRDDIRRHIDETAQDEVMEGVKTPTPVAPTASTAVQPQPNPNNQIPAPTAQQELLKQTLSSDKRAWVEEDDDDEEPTANAPSGNKPKKRFRTTDKDKKWFQELGIQVASKVAVQTEEGVNLVCPACHSIDARKLETDAEDGSLVECLACGCFFAV